MEETPPPPTGNAPHPSSRMMGVQVSTDGAYEHGGTFGSGSIATSHDAARGGGVDNAELASFDVAGLSTLGRATVDMRWDAEVR